MESDISHISLEMVSTPYFVNSVSKAANFDSKVWFNTPRLASAVRNQRMRVFGIKPDILNKFPLEEPPFQCNPTLKIPQGLPCGGSF
jgi:hypothetical protein